MGIYTYVGEEIYYSWRTKTLTFLKIFLPEGHDYVKTFSELRDSDFSNAQICAKTLENVKSYLEKGFISFEEKKVIDVDDILERIFSRFHKVARQLRDRYNNKPTDTCFEILDTVPKKYHLECQSTSDSSMLIRMFEYGAQIALDDGKVRKNVLTVNFPHSAILYLRCGKDTPVKIRVVVRSPAGELDYEIAVVKLKSYSLEEIFSKKLLFLIPFYIFTHESRLKVYDEDKEQRKALLEEHQYIRDRLEELALADEIDEYIKRTLMEMTDKILEYLARNHKKVRKGVKSVMVGKVLDYEAKRILNRGISQGKIDEMI